MIKDKRSGYVVLNAYSCTSCKCMTVADVTQCTFIPVQVKTMTGMLHGLLLE